MKFSQLTGIIWYEMRLQWRRRAMLVVVLSFVIMMSFFIYMQYRSMAESGLSELPIDMATITLVMGLAPVGMLVMMLTLPPIVAETIPKDRQYGVDELLKATPMTPGLYLVGKVLGTWLSLVVMTTVIALFEWALARIAFGPIKISMYLTVWLQGIMPLSFFVSGMSVLLASRQPTRRRATMIGGLFTMYCMVTIPVINEASYTWLQAFIPAAWIQVMFRFMFMYLEVGQASPAVSEVLPHVPQQFVWRTLIAAAVQILVIGLVTYGWWRSVEMKD